MITFPKCYYCGDKKVIVFNPGHDDEKTINCRMCNPTKKQVEVQELEGDFSGISNDDR